MSGVLASLLIRSAIILLAAELLRRFPSRSAPAYRHRMLLAGFALLLLWPLFAALLPEIHLSPWSRLSAATGTVTIRQTVFIRTHSAAPPLNWPVIIWCCGTLLGLAPALTGYTNIARLSRRAVPLRDLAWTGLLNETSNSLGLARPPALLVLSAPVMPMTFGLWHPRVLLPADCLSWTLAKRRAVLLHELAHIARRDVVTQLLASVVTACWWFQPLCWSARRSLRRESERACDALVVAQGVRPSDYASQLLEIAQTFKRDRYSPAAIAMARKGEIEGRLHAILAPGPRPCSSASFAAALSILSVLAVSASAVTLAPRSQIKLPRGVFMKRTVLSGLLASAGLSAATISGSLFDPSGEAVANAKASLYNPDTAAKQETTTTPDGKFAFEALPAGQYILQIEKPGFAVLFREFNVQPESKVERGLTLDLSAPKAGANSQPFAPQRIRVAGAAEQSNLTTKIQPVYPKAAKAAHIQGTVLLEAVISAEGVPLDIRVVSSPDPDLTQSALEAVRQWRYNPTLLNGKAVEVVTDIIVNYTLSS